MPFLSQAWLDLHTAAAADLPEHPGATARILHVVTGSPDGEVRYVQRTVDGRLQEATLGDDPTADVTLTQTYADAREIADGTVDLMAAFMQGRVKVVGDMSKLLALMPLTRSEEHRAAALRVAEHTAF